MLTFGFDDARKALAVLLLAPLFGACSAAPGSEGATSSSTQAETADATDAAAAVPCSATQPCAAGQYCAPSDSTSTCGAGTCVTSPWACPMIQNPVCGCDGNTYLNACRATKGSPNQPGSTSAGNLYVAPTTPALVGTWSRSSGSGSSATKETLSLHANGTYSLTETVGCSGRRSSTCTRSESAGTYTMSTVGIVFASTSESNAASLATEFYLENTCPVTGSLELVGYEPPGSDTQVTLTQE